jgi:acyl-CoA-binding protein
MQTHEILFYQKPTNGQAAKESKSDISDLKDKLEQTTMAGPKSLDDDHKIKFLDWGFKVDYLFDVAYKFYKQNENKAFHLSFDERNKMVALVMQAKFGNYDGGKVSDVGALDLVGKRRHYEWSLLKGMTKTEAMTKFICELDEVCPLFKAYAEAVKISSGLDGSKDHNNVLGNGVNRLAGQSGDPSLLESSAQFSSIYTSLCKQTHDQFKSYAEKQHPGDLVKQKYLITSLQEQYYQQYISQMHPKLNLHLKDSVTGSDQSSNTESNAASSMSSPVTTNISIDNKSSSHFINTESSANIRDEKPNLNAPAVRTTSVDSSCIEVLSSNAADGQSKKGESKNVNLNDIICEGNDVQTDISCEELNSESNCNVNGDTDEVDHIGQESRQTLPEQVSLTENADTSNLDLVPETSQLNLTETVKLGQNIDLPPIGMFESFPEPKLVRAPHRKSTEIEPIDPNMPFKAIQNVQSMLTDKTEHNEKIESDQKKLDIDSKQTSVINSQDPVCNSNSQYNSEQNLAPDFLPVPTAYSESNQSDNYQPEFEPVNNIVDAPEIAGTTTELPPESHQPPELWGPASSSDGCSPFDPQATYNYEPIEPATIWTKPAVAEFKDSLGGDKQGGVYEVKESALIVIQVPTYPDGRYIYWEFATDNYDIGFGVDFVYDEHLIEPLALNIYQDNDDDDLEDLIDNWHEPKDLMADPELCQSEVVSDRDRLLAEKRRRLANTVPIVPTYRRDSHEEVFVGRHKYPGRGYYLLKFDNTYSVLRSKTLYFRICYFM